MEEENFMKYLNIFGRKMLGNNIMGSNRRRKKHKWYKNKINLMI